MRVRPTVVSIAGHDPSAGAGILADIKTFEQHKVYGLGVISALTWQNESEFEKVEWVAADKIVSQLEIVLRKTKVEYAKIGLVENPETFAAIVQHLTTHYPAIRIIWDPILNASAGFDFHSGSSRLQWQNVLSDLYLITPNWKELFWLAEGKAGQEGAALLSRQCHVLLKGGHNPEKPGYDYLFLKTTEQQMASPKLTQFAFRPKSKIFPKHGSGCVLSASITALLARGYQPQRACLMAKNYVTRFLLSQPGLLGFHHL